MPDRIGQSRGIAAVHIIGLLAALSFLVMVGAGAMLLFARDPDAADPSLGALSEEIERANARRAALREMEPAAFALIDQTGQPVTEAALRDRYTVMSFMFTYCTLACPLMMGNMYRVYTEAPPHVRLLSMSVDPVNDTPERLAEYARDLGVAAPKWRMLSGPEKVVRSVARSLGFDFETDASQMIDMGDGRRMANIVHPTRFLLFGPDGRIIDSYNGMDRDDVDRLLLELRALPAIADEDDAPGE
ncbi:MAG: SCO family protein [Phycisphaerales bacterium]